MMKLNLKKGSWVVADCSAIADAACNLVMMAPASQREIVIDAALDHAAECHANKSKDPAQMRKKIEQCLSTVEM